MKVGIWLPIWPGTEWKYEGLPRLLNFILAGLDTEKNDTRFVIVVPYWVNEYDIDDYLSTFSTDQRNRIEFQRVKRSNFFERIFVYQAKRMQAKRKQSAIAKQIRTARQKRNRVLRFRRRSKQVGQGLALNTPSIVVIGLAILVAFAIIKMISAPIVILVLATLLATFMIWYFRSSIRRIPRLIQRIVQYERVKSLIYTIGNQTLEPTLKKMAESAHQKVKIDVWYIPHIGYSSGTKLKGKKVWLFADYVFYDCPSGFPPSLIAKSRRSIKRSLESADSVITISEHVSKRHLIGVFQFNPNKNITVHHAFADISDRLPFLQREADSGRYALLPVEKTSESLQAANKLIRAQLHEMATTRLHILGKKSKNFSAYLYLMGLDFSDTPYIMVSTKNRPYKNTFAVIQAVRAYNEVSLNPVKLLVTDDLGLDDSYSAIGNYILEHGLEQTVLPLPNVPNTMHAALYHCATVSVGATFFEGGTGSFIFDEAVSVGTPSLLSRNLSHDEGLGHFKNYSTFTFDPFNINQLIEKLNWVINGGAKDLYKLQWEIAAHRHESRNWSHVCDEYCDVFRNVTSTIHTPKI